MNWRGAQNIDDLRRIAQRRLPRAVYEFVARGSEGEIGLGHNRAVLDALKIKARVMVDVSQRNSTTRLLGHAHRLPLVVAPTGAAGLLWYQGEVALARAAASAGVPYTLGMSSLTPMETVRQACDGALWFQLYLSPEQAVTDAMLDRARNAGFDALVLTVDTVVSPNREYNSHNGFSVPLRLNRRNGVDFALHPGWAWNVVGRYLRAGGLPRFENYPQAMRERVAQGQRGRWAPVQRDETATWANIARLRERWGGPLIIKGIGCLEDAQAAVAAGADALVLSNHGARNLDSAASPMEVLAGVVRAVAGRCPVWVDSGFVRGSDVFKALALGAQAVLVGRGALYGVAAGGFEGSRRALTFYHEELLRCMAYAGVSSVAELGPAHLMDAATPASRASAVHAPI